MASARPASHRSGSEQETPDGQSRFVIPPAIDDCGDVPSPSQHRLLYASQRCQAGLDRDSDDQDQDDDTQSEEEGNSEMSSSSVGGEEEEESEKSEEEQHEDEEQGDNLSSDSNVASSRAPSKQQSRLSSQKQLVMLVRNLQKEVEMV